MAPPRLESTLVQGWRAEFHLWWGMARHVEVVLDRSPLANAGPGSIWMCRDCCQILSTRTCSGTTMEAAIGCDFHKISPQVPIAVRSTITSTRLREMWKPNMIVERYFLSSATEPIVSETDLMQIDWVQRIRDSDKRTKRSKKTYIHDADGGCIHSNGPDSIVQGLGPRGLYFKRCDGRFINAFGEHLEISEPKQDIRHFTPKTHESMEIQREGQEDVTTILTKDKQPSDDVNVNEELQIEPDQQYLAGAIQDYIGPVKATEEFRQPLSFNEKADPWADINRIQTAEPTSPTTTAPTRNSTPSTTFLMPYEFAAAKEKKAQSFMPPPHPTELNVDPQKLAELAWRRLNMPTVAQEERQIAEDREARKRKKRWWKLWR